MTDIELTGHSIIAGTVTPGAGGTVAGIDPRSGAELEPTYSLLDLDQVRKATAAAHRAARSYRDTDPSSRAEFLDLIASKLE